MNCRRRFELSHLGTMMSHIVTNANHVKFQSARTVLERALKNEYQGHLFHLNTLYVAPPVVSFSFGWSSGCGPRYYRGGCW